MESNKLNLSIFIFVLLVLTTTSSYSQTQVGLKTVEIEGDRKIDENVIERKAFELLNASNDEDKKRLNQELKSFLTIELNKTEATNHHFNQIESISILAPTDSTFLVFNWNIPWSDGTFNYECGILKRIGFKKNGFQFLKDTIPDKSIEERYVSSKNTWIPRLFYQLIETSTQYQTYYTLLAWDGNNLLTNKKSIEVLWFDKSESPRFGAPIFRFSNAEAKSRIIFEYGGQNRMKLQFNDALNRIEYDHLSPSSNNLKGVYEYYGADLSFDGFVWNKRFWQHHSDINIDEGLSKSAKDFKIDKDVIRERKPIYIPNN